MNENEEEKENVAATNPTPKKRGWVTRPITFTRQQINNMTLEDFGDPVSDLAQKILSRSKSELHRRMVSDDPEVRLAAYKESLAQKVRVIEKDEEKSQ